MYQTTTTSFVKLTQVRYTANCKPFTSNKCQVIRYQECDEEPIVDCKYKEKQIPWQKLIHKKKCLLPDNVSIEVILIVGNCDIHADGIFCSLTR
jgi:hypothetical protein